MDMDEARIDADLGKLLQHIKEGQQNMSDQPGLCFYILIDKYFIQNE